jgi:hypothetical protein
MMQRPVKQAMFMAAAGVLALSAEVLARPYTFKKIADTAGDFSSVVSPTINAAGTVAFFATYDGVGAGIFTGNGGPITTIVDTFTVFSDIRTDSSINAHGVVAFRATVFEGPTGLYVGSGGPLTTIADASGPFQNFGPSPSINDAGMVAFMGIPDVGRFGVFAGDGTTTVTIADGNGPVGNFGNPSINNSGVAAFYGELKIGGMPGVFASSGGGAVTTIADSTGPLNGFGHPLGQNGILQRGKPSINASGAVAFHAKMDESGEGVFVGSGAAPPLSAADTVAGPFDALGNIVMNGSGQVAFEGSIDSRGSGIYTGNNLTMDLVVHIGDKLFGSTISHYSLGGINDRGEIVFRYGASNNQDVIAVASPAVDGDADLDGDIDLSDLGILATHFGQIASAMQWTNGDFDDDKDVDLNDLGALATNFEGGRAAAFAEFQALVPEPGVGLLLLACLPAVLRHSGDRCVERRA